MATSGRKKRRGRGHLIFLGTIIVILTGFIIYEYLNIGISVSLVMNTSLLIITDILSIVYFINLLKSDNKIKN